MPIALAQASSGALSATSAADAIETPKRHADWLRIVRQRADLLVVSSSSGVADHWTEVSLYPKGYFHPTHYGGAVEELDDGRLDRLRSIVR